MWRVVWWLMGDQQPNKVSCYVTLCGSSELVGFYDLGSEPSDSIKGARLVELFMAFDCSDIFLRVGYKQKLLEVLKQKWG
jgi:hypothetical protein